MGRVFNGVYLSVYPHDISQTAAARITKLDIKCHRSSLCTCYGQVLGAFSNVLDLVHGTSAKVAN